jgi:Amt family ammonium transporter
LIQKKPDLGMIINGTLAGLVAITAGCDAVSMTGALLIGGIAGVLAVLAVFMFEKIRVDDPVGALSVHLVNGVWGTLAYGLFATTAGSLSTVNGLFYGGGLGLLGIQAIGVLAVAAFVAVASTIGWYAIKVTIGLRVNAHEELEGLDVGEHGQISYELEEHHVADTDGSALSTFRETAKAMGRKMKPEPAMAQ